MQFRKIAAVTGSAIMAGMTFAGAALAAVTNVADFGQLASASDGKAQLPLFVVGAQAKTSDVAAAINLAARLAGNAVTTSKISTTSAGAAADGITFRMEIGNTTALTRDFDPTSLVSLQSKKRGGYPASFLNEGTITLSGTDYKYYELIGMASAHLQGALGSAYRVERGTTGAGNFEDALQDLGISMPSDNLYYNVTWDTPIFTGSNNLTANTIKFLGSEYTVVSSTGTKVELSSSAGAVSIKEGESAEIAGYTVKVDSVAASGTARATVIVCKGDACSVATSFNEGDSKTLKVGSDDVPVTVQTVTLGRSATVLAGLTAIKMENGNSITQFPDWKATIIQGGNTNTIKHLSVVYKQPRTSFTGQYPVLLEGKEIVLPTGFAKLKFVGMEERSYYRFTFEPTTGDFDGNGASGDQGVVISITDPDTGAAVKAFDVGGTFSDKIAYDLSNGKNWKYWNTTPGWDQSLTTLPTVQLSEKTLNWKNVTSINTVGGERALTGAQDAVFVFEEPSLSESAKQYNWTIEADYAYVTGATRFDNITNDRGDSSTNPVYLTYGGYNSSYKLGNSNTLDAIAYGGSTPKQRAKYTSDYGTKLVSVSRDRIVLDVPKLQVYADLLLGKEAGAGTGGTVETQKVAPVTFDVAKLDTEVDTATLASDVVVVGGPCVNELAAKLLDTAYPACEEASGITKDTALVQVFQNAFGSGKVAFLVAGWEAADTENAASALQAGTITNKVAAVEVAGTTVTEK